MSELDEFKATYFDECSELLTELEEQFMAIEEGDHDAERLNAVFRAIHSIKGGAGAFGFTKLVEFAHSFETLLDFVRDGRVELNDEVVALCIRSSDLVADFVSAAQEDRELDEGYGAEQKAAFEALCNPDGEAGEEDAPEDFDIEFTPVMVNVGDDSAQDAGPSEDDIFESAPLGVDSDLNAALDDAEDDLSDSDIVFAADSTDGAPEFGEAVDAWTLTFTPLRALFERANDPLLLFRELHIVGESQINADIREVPELSEFEPFHPYCSWVITLKGDDVTEERIREVFEFVEGDCEIEITPPGGISEQRAASLVGDLDEAQATTIVTPDEMIPDIPEAPEAEAGGGEPSFADLAGSLGVDMDVVEAEEPAAPAADSMPEAPSIKRPQRQLKKNQLKICLHFLLWPTKRKKRRQQKPKHLHQRRHQRLRLISLQQRRHQQNQKRMKSHPFNPFVLT
jgi:two-component system chemotaxis sensor kinase CheA